MDKREQAFVRNAMGDGPGLEIIQTFITAAIPFVVMLRAGRFDLRPLGPGDRVYVRNVREEDILIVRFLYGVEDDPYWALEESNEGGGR